MKHLAAAVSCTSFILLSACASGPPAGPPPRACGLAEFGEAPGIDLPSPQKKAAGNKSAPDQMASPLAVDKGTDEAGKWYDAAPGWKAWRIWLRSDGAKSMSVQLQPFDLPDGAQLWVCAPDSTLRQGPITGRGPGNDGSFFSGIAKGPEVWVELLVPERETKDAKLRVAKAFGGVR
jgi:hypothetical protein